MARKFDLVLFGVTGFTGKWALEKLIHLGNTGKYPRKFTWAVAGRNAGKMKQAVDEVSKITKTDLSQVAMIEASVDDLASLRAMAAQCSVVMSVVGPYILYGRNQVEACVAESTSFVDLTGEVPFIAEMYRDFNAEAEKKGAYIINSCGYDSVLMDYGIAALQEKFPGDFNEVTCVMNPVVTEAPKGAALHYGTYHSIVQMMSKARELRSIEKQIFKEKLPKSVFPPSFSSWKPLYYDDELQKWCVQVKQGPDMFHTRRSQYLAYKSEGRQPAQVMQFQALPNLIACLGVGLVMAVIFVLAQFSCTKRLLEQYPRVFTLGFASHEGPSREESEKAVVKAVIRGVGWNDKVGKDGTRSKDSPPNVKKNLTVTVRNPGYGATSIILIESALTILFQKDKIPSTGGVLPPGAAFAKTDLAKRLDAAGVTFDFEIPVSSSASSSKDK